MNRIEKIRDLLNELVDANTAQEYLDKAETNANPPNETAVVSGRGCESKLVILLPTPILVINDGDHKEVEVKIPSDLARKLINRRMQALDLMLRDLGISL